MNDQTHSLRTFCGRLLTALRTFPSACLVLIAGLVFAGVHVLFYTTARDNAVPLLILGCLLAWRGVNRLSQRSKTKGAFIAAWVLIVLVPLSLQLPYGSQLKLDSLLAMLLIGLAIVTYTNGFSGLVRLFPALFLTCILIPIQEQMFLALSYPLRLLSTLLTVEPLQLFGLDISYQLTTITIGTYQVAITDACSGIAQFAVLLLLGYVVVLLKTHRTSANALLHYLSLVPVLIFANAVRLVITILLFYLIGEAAFSNTYHAGLGYFFVIFSTLLFYWIGSIFPDRDTDARLSEPNQKTD